jgi:hypothetical protein
LGGRGLGGRGLGGGGREVEDREGGQGGRRGSIIFQVRGYDQVR